MVDEAGMVLGWQQTVEAAYQQLMPSVFGKAKPGDPDLQQQREDADKARRADDYVQSTGELPDEAVIPPLFGGWGSRRR